MKSAWTFAVASFSALAAVMSALSATAGIEPFTVDFSQAVGKIRPLNGLCNATPLYNSRTRSINDKVLKLEIPYYRFHDASLENPGVGRVLVATMRTDDSVIPITLKGGVRPVSVKVIDLVQDFEESADWKWDEKSGKLTLCRNLGDSTVWLIEVKTAD